MKAQLGTGRSVEVKQSLKGRQHPSLGRVCEAIVNRGMATIGEAPESVRGLTRVQYPSRVDERGYGG